MTASQLNAELFRAMGEIADDETLMKKVLNYVKRLAAKKEDPTLMTKEEFFAMLDKGEEEYRQGKTHSITSVEQLKRSPSTMVSDSRCLPTMSIVSLPMTSFGFVTSRIPLA